MSATESLPKTQTVFACTHVEKIVTVDSYEKGCSTESDTILFESANIEAESFEKLIEAIGKEYCLDIDDVWTPEEDNGELTHIGFNRLEDGDGCDPSPEEIEQWKRGKLKLWLADYSFAVEVRTVRALTLQDVKASGVKFHG